VPYLDKISALVTEEGGLTSHAAIVSLEAGIPCVVGAQGVVSALQTGQIITVNSNNGAVYIGVVNAGA
ncbi:MAG: PEP-utilizing enzyme, partial [Pyramidobacter sp.]|nr:PEP-utilizing enzyme [Pyramidobacter sp.]